MSENNSSLGEPAEEPPDPDGLVLSYASRLKSNFSVTGQNLESSGWKDLIRKSISTPKQLSAFLGIPASEFEEICLKYPAKINPYYLALALREPGIYKQCIPSNEEINDNFGFEDPLNEEGESNKGNVPKGITHRYPDRVLFLVSNQCAMYCRFCTRKRKVGDLNKPKQWSEILEGIEYIREHSEVRDVILSGGDPLMLDDSLLEKIIKSLREIEHVKIIRIGTRMPCTLPQRITPELCNMLKKYHPIYVNTHFNHPAEITPESERACAMLVDAGIPVGCQTVLLKGINDNVEIMKRLMQKLIEIRVKPYYIYQTDLVKGTNHFRTRVEKGLEIIKGIRGYTSGLCVPHFVIDAPGGGGKIPLLPEYVKRVGKKKVVLKNYKDKKYEYIQAD